MLAKWRKWNLYLGRTKVTDAGMKDAGLKALHQLITQLEFLDLKGAKAATNGGSGNSRKALPDCRVER